MKTESTNNLSGLINVINRFRSSQDFRDATQIFPNTAAEKTDEIFHQNAKSLTNEHPAMPANANHKK